MVALGRGSSFSASPQSPEKGTGRRRGSLSMQVQDRLDLDRLDALADQVTWPLQTFTHFWRGLEETHTSKVTLKGGEEGRGWGGDHLRPERKKEANKARPGSARAQTLPPVCGPRQSRSDAGEAFGLLLSRGHRLKTLKNARALLDGYRSLVDAPSRMRAALAAKPRPRLGEAVAVRPPSTHARARRPLPVFAWF